MIKGLFSIVPAFLSGRLMVLALFLSLQGLTQPPRITMYSYIETYSLEAVRQMIEYKIPASVIMAQALFESKGGMSKLARKSNNHFGIKCHDEWDGKIMMEDDDDYDECFRKYDRIEDSYTDHSRFLSSRPRYSSLFALPITDYKSWCQGLKDAGYATHPSYADDLIRLIEAIKLYELDGAEHLQSGGFRHLKTEIVRSKYSPALFPVTVFSETGLLWQNEEDILVQSLELVIEHTYEVAPGRVVWR